MNNEKTTNNKIVKEEVRAIITKADLIKVIKESNNGSK